MEAAIFLSRQEMAKRTQKLEMQTHASPHLQLMDIVIYLGIYHWEGCGLEKAWKATGCQGLMKSVRLMRWQSGGEKEKKLLKNNKGSEVMLEQMGLGRFYVVFFFKKKH